MTIITVGHILYVRMLLCRIMKDSVCFLLFEASINPN